MESSMARPLPALIVSEVGVEGGGRMCKRTVIEGDAFRVLGPPPPRPETEETQEKVEVEVEMWGAGTSVVTSIPDVSEVSMALKAWKDWFELAALRIMERIHPSQVAIFYQSDIKVDGRWIDKAFIVQKARRTLEPLWGAMWLRQDFLSLLMHLQAAEKAGCHLLWHKIMMITKPNDVKFGRPGYTHMLCFSKERLDDVLHSSGTTHHPPPPPPPAPPLALTLTRPC